MSAPRRFRPRTELLVCVLMAFTAGYGLTVLFASRLGGGA